MIFGVGPYRLMLPRDSEVLPTKASSVGTPTLIVRAHVGVFELSGLIVAGTLRTYLEFVEYETRGSATVENICVNGVPGLRQVSTPGNARRLDYAFQSIGLECIELVAWADRDSSESEIGAIDSVVRTLHLRDRFRMM